jgi:hypothetical protein
MTPVHVQRPRQGIGHCGRLTTVPLSSSKAKSSTRIAVVSLEPRQLEVGASAGRLKKSGGGIHHSELSTRRCRLTVQQVELTQRNHVLYHRSAADQVVVHIDGSVGLPAEREQTRAAGGRGDVPWHSIQRGGVVNLSPMKAPGPPVQLSKVILDEGPCGRISCCVLRGHEKAPGKLGLPPDFRLVGESRGCWDTWLSEVELASSRQRLPRATQLGQRVDPNRQRDRRVRVKGKSPVGGLQRGRESVLRGQQSSASGFGDVVATRLKPK